jgi:DNA invertase Pin-like site-specific DNA recombinase
MTRIETPAATHRECDFLRSAVAPHVSATISPKILPCHFERLAVVYVRQSTPHQVLQHRESRERQYALADHAVSLGWHRDRVLVIDDDQGRSGKTAENRNGFHRVLAEVTMDHVGLVLGIEMSRLARSNKDWRQLLELCAVFGTILADEDGVYNPNDSNDRLLLGLKGTISEFELVTMRNRLDRGRRNKARRGELFTLAPIGYVRHSSDELAFDPDEQVRAVVHLIFEKFEEFGSASAVVRYFTRHGIQVGVRTVNGRVPSPVEWHPLGPSTLLEMLHNPTYAGTYSQGRRGVDRQRSRPSPPRPCRRFLPMEEWDVLLNDAVPAYITWDQFVANQATLSRNRAKMSTLGSARNGGALLPGLLICGHC